VLLPRRMLGRNVQRVEIVEVVLDMRSLGHGEAEIAEDLDHFLPDLRHRMHGARALWSHRQRDIDLLRGKPRLESGFLKCCLAHTKGFAHAVLQQVERGTGLAAFIGAHAAERLHALGDGALLAERRDAHGFDGRFVGCGGDLREDILFEGLETHLMSLKMK
jgi:hypothetical protein